MAMDIKWRYLAFVLVVLFLSHAALIMSVETQYISAVGDPGMKRDGLRVAIESWNQCNEVGDENQQTGSPRHADCFDIYRASPTPSLYPSSHTDAGTYSCL